MTCLVPATRPGGSSGQLQWNNGPFAGAAFSTVATSGNLLTLTAGADSDIPLLVKGHSATQSGNLTEWRSSGGTLGACITAAREFSNAVVTGSEQFGAGAAVAAGKDQSTAIGYQAACGGRAAVAMGYQATASTSVSPSAIAIGANATATGATGAIAIGGSAQSTVSDGIAIGINANANARGIAIGNACTLGGVQGFCAGLNAVQRNTGDFTWCWDTGASSTSGFLLQGRSSTSTTRDLYRIVTAWADSTDATRKGRAMLTVYDTAARECIRLEASGSAAMLGLYGASAVAQQTVTGSRGGNAALASLLSALATLGAIVDGTSA